MKTTGNTILITGGTSGIGLGLALRFHDAGNTVIIAGRREHLLDQIAAEHPGIHTQVLDVSDPTSIASAHQTLTDRYPGLNVLVNNAGIMQPEFALDREALVVAETTIATNLLAPIRLSYAFAPFLANRPDVVIINVTSGLAFVPLSLTPTYSASKAALHSFTESLRLQLADAGIQVIEMIPPLTATTLMGSQDNPMAMPLEDLLTESLAILDTRPDVEQVIVERVKQLRFAEATGTYDAVLAGLNRRSAPPAAAR